MSCPCPYPAAPCPYLLVCAGPAHWTIQMDPLRFDAAINLHTIWSYEKLTTAGMTMLDSDLIGTLEKFLPSRFGGGPTDYQLLEEEVEGEPRIKLLINPEVRVVDLNKIGKAFLKEIRAGSGLWRTTGFFTVERRKSIPAASGKILHLHIRRGD